MRRRISRYGKSLLLPGRRTQSGKISEGSMPDARAISVWFNSFWTGGVRGIEWSSDNANHEPCQNTRADLRRAGDEGMPHPSRVVPNKKGYGDEHQHRSDHLVERLGFEMRCLAGAEPCAKQASSEQICNYAPMGRNRTERYGVRPKRQGGRDRTGFVNALQQVGLAWPEQGLGTEDHAQPRQRVFRHGSVLSRPVESIYVPWRMLIRGLNESNGRRSLVCCRYLAGATHGGLKHGAFATTSGRTVRGGL
jgi:hypothetical protein